MNFFNLKMKWTHKRKVPISTLNEWTNRQTEHPLKWTGFHCLKHERCWESKEKSFQKHDQVKRIEAIRPVIFGSERKKERKVNWRGGDTWLACPNKLACCRRLRRNWMRTPASDAVKRKTKHFYGRKRRRQDTLIGGSLLTVCQASNDVWKKKEEEETFDLKWLKSKVKNKETKVTSSIQTQKPKRWRQQNEVEIDEPDYGVASTAVIIWHQPKLPATRIER